LSSYYQYTSTETPKLARDGYEGVPTVISMPDVFINNLGFFWNAKVSDPLACEAPYPLTLV